MIAVALQPDQHILHMARQKLSVHLREPCGHRVANSSSLCRICGNLRPCRIHPVDDSQIV
jgi:hypothetical protein